MKRKITMYSSQTASIQERFQQFLSAASANGFSERTLKMYRQHLHSLISSERDCKGYLYRRGIEAAA